MDGVDEAAQAGGPGGFLINTFLTFFTKVYTQTDSVFKTESVFFSPFAMQDL